MPGGRASRQKGNRTDRAIVHLVQRRGFAAERVPLSAGAARGRFSGDVSVPVLGADRRIEVKCATMDSASSTNGSTAPTC